MKKFFEDRKQKFIKDIYNRNPDVMEKLKEVFGRVLDDMFEEFETSGLSTVPRQQGTILEQAFQGIIGLRVLPVCKFKPCKQDRRCVSGNGEHIPMLAAAKRYGLERKC